jgi:hypothetical protein
MTVLPDDGYYVDLAEVPTDADVVSELGASNAARGLVAKPVWSFVVEDKEHPDWGVWPSVWLEAGTAGSTGALQWVEGEASAGQARLSQDEWLAYVDRSGTPCGVHVALQVPIEQVFVAVAELTATRRRPTSIEWTRIDGSEHRLIGPRPQATPD